jgi:hypothetical protein
MDTSQDDENLAPEAPHTAVVPVARRSKTPPSRIPLATGRRESIPENNRKRRRVDTERAGSVPLEMDERSRPLESRARKHRRAASQGPSYILEGHREAKRPRRSTGGSFVLGAARVSDWNMAQEDSADFVQVDWVDPIHFSKPEVPTRAKSESRILSRLDARPALLQIPVGDHAPNSSSELSPVGRQMMVKAREQRRRTTDPHSQAERKKLGARA